MRHILITAAILALFAAQVTWAQTQAPMKPTAPGTPGDPVWQGVLRASDGRMFITDGGFVIDAALAKPANLPARELPAKVLEGYFAAAHDAECTLSELTVVERSKTYDSPTGVRLNATYIDYLRRILPAASVRLRMTGERQPVVVAVDGRPVGVLMPVAK